MHLRASSTLAQSWVNLAVALAFAATLETVRVLSPLMLKS
jgi:hypothetical protein